MEPLDLDLVLDLLTGSFLTLSFLLDILDVRFSRVKLADPLKARPTWPEDKARFKDVNLLLLYLGEYPP